MSHNSNQSPEVWQQYKEWLARYNAQFTKPATPQSNPPKQP